MPEFYPPQSFPLRTHEWAYVLSVAVVNVALWTGIFGFGVTAIRRFVRANDSVGQHPDRASGLPH